MSNSTGRLSQRSEEAEMGSVKEYSPNTTEKLEYDKLSKILSTDFSQMNDEELINLHFCILKSVYDMKSTNLVISLMHKLIADDLYSSIFLVNCIDALFSFLDYFSRQPLSQTAQAKKQRSLIESSIKSCLDKIASSIVLPSSMKQLSSCLPTTFLPFAARGLDLILNFKLDNPAVLKFVINSLKNLSASDKLGSYQQLPENCKQLLQQMMIQCDEQNIKNGYMTELFSFLIKFKGIEDTAEFVDSILQFAAADGKKTAEYINVRQLMITVFAPLPNSTVFISKVVPNEEELIQLFKDLEDEKTDQKYLSTSFGIIAKSVDNYNGKNEILLSYLSLPWICDIGWQLWEGFQKSLPLLSFIKTHEDKFRDLFSTPSLKSISLKAMSHLTIKNEWRSLIFKEALHSPIYTVQIAALNALPYFCTSIATYSFIDVLTPLIQNLSEQNLSESLNLITVVESLIRSLSLCICVSGDQYKILADKQIICSLCETKNGCRKNVKINFPPAFFALLLKIVEIEEEEYQLKIDFITLLCSAVRHLAIPDETVEELIRISLPFFEASPGIATSYVSFIEEVVQLKLSSDIIFQITERIFKTDDLLCTEYFTVCGKNASDPKFALDCIIQVICTATVRITRSPKMVQNCISMIEELAAKENIKPGIYFIRHSVNICQYTVKRLYSICTEIFSDENASSSECGMRCVSVIENYFLTMAKVFVIGSKKEKDKNVIMKEFLRLASSLLLPPLLIHYKVHGVIDHTQIFKCILHKMSDIQKRENTSLFKDALPRILWYFSFIKKVPWTDSFFKRRIEHVINGRTMFTLIKDTLSKSIFAIILCLGKSEECAKSYLEKIFEVQWESKSKQESLSVTACVSSCYLGLLLEFRRAFSSQYYYLYRKDIIHSLVVFMNNIDTKLISQCPGQMISVLKAISPIEDSLDAWMTFLNRLDPKILVNQIHHILFAAAGLTTLPGANKIIDFIFEIRKKSDNTKFSCQRFDRAVLVLYNSEKKFNRDLYPSFEKEEDLLLSCAKILIEESSDVQALVLPQLLRLMDECEMNFEIINELIHALLHALKTSVTDQAKRLIGICIGKIGAIDPGKIGIAAVGDISKRHIDRRPLPLKFVDDLNQFFAEILEVCAKLLIECKDADKVDFIAFVIQEILKELNSPDVSLVKQSVNETLNKELLHEISPYKTSTYKPRVKDHLVFDVKPFAENCTSYEEWLWKWYFAASDNIKDMRLGRVFKSIQYIYYSGDTSLPQVIIPQVILQGLIESNHTIITEANSEISAVFKKALSSDGWIRMAAQTCFQIIEFIEKYEAARRDSTVRYLKAGERERIKNFLFDAINQPREGTGELLSVAVAEKYNSSCRALRWLESYGIKVSPKGEVEFNRNAMFALERIYLQLSDTDGVLGAYETIQKNATASPQERVIAFEATGNHTEALPLYQLDPIQKLPLVKCMLRLNQPLIAFNLASNFSAQEKDEKIKQKLCDYQIEAAYRREEWSNLNQILASNSAEITSWGAHVASIFAGIQTKSKQEFDIRIRRAREQVMKSLKAVTMEGADTYSQAYRYIQRLHILFEIEEGADVMKLFSISHQPTPVSFDKLCQKWSMRSENAIQCSSVLEPIYWVRRELLKFSNPIKNKDKISHLLVESSKLSRQAGHLSTSWAHLINARELGIEHDLNIDVEEARYFFQRGQKGEAICSLQKTLEKHFSSLVSRQKMVSKENATVVLAAAQHAAGDFRMSSQAKADFVKTELEHTSFLEKANAANVTELYIKHCFMDGIGGKNEQQSYAFAVFFDNSYYSRSPEDMENAMACLKLYARVLCVGRRYLLHVMPRMLTIWLDFYNTKTEEENVSPTAKKRKSIIPTTTKETIIRQDVTEFMVTQFQTLDPFYFFTAFPQLISRLCHPNENVYKALSNMIADLMVLYPHECLWQSIASYRSNEKQEPLRHARTRQTFGIATKKAKKKDASFNLETMIKEYNEFAGLIMKVAEKSEKELASGEYSNFNKTFPKFKQFFKNDSKVAVPFITMVEKKMPTFNASQISLPVVDDSTIYIKSIEDNFKVFGSMEKPKLFTIVGSNDVRYSLIAKKSDELRKDSRCLDFCRMVNTLLLRDSEARRRQLHIRTYSVIPLQACGGLIEVVPNLTHLRGCVSTANETDTFKQWSAVKSDKKKRRQFFDDLVKKNPVKMAEFFRKSFVDPCKWYGAKLAFTRTTATMSMVGFILGLGDRHCENILLDHTNGDIVHVDFNLLFNKGEELPTPEKIPFRLTRNMVDGFGPTGVEGTFRKSCEIVMRILREERETLCSVLQTFIHDPLLEWSNIDPNQQQMRGAKKPEKKKLDPQVESSEAISLLSARLDGKIVTLKCYPLSKSVISMSVEGQVAQLIRMATDYTTLSDMYMGWNPHI